MQYLLLHLFVFRVSMPPRVSLKVLEFISNLEAWKILKNYFGR